MVRPLQLEQIVVDYLKLFPDWREHRRDSAFLKVVEMARRLSGAESVSNMIEKFRSREISPAPVLQKVVSELVAQGLKPRTVADYVGTLKRFLEFHDALPPNEWRKVRLPRRSQARVDRLPGVDVLQRLILSPRSPRLRLFLQLLAQTGMRRGESLRLKVNYIDFERKVIVVPGEITKTGRTREIPLHPELEKAIMKYLEGRRVKSDWLFPSLKDPSRPWGIGWLTKSYFEVLERLGLNQKTIDGTAYALHLHVFRKWFRSRCEAAGVNPVLLDRWLGHGEGVRHIYTLFDPETLRREIEKMYEAVRLFGRVEYASEDRDRLREEILSEILPTLRRELENFRRSLVDYGGLIHRALVGETRIDEPSEREARESERLDRILELFGPEGEGLDEADIRRLRVAIRRATDEEFEALIKRLRLRTAR